MYLAQVKLRFSKIDQVNLEQKVKEWKKETPCDHFMFRGYGEALQDLVSNSAFEEDEDEVKDTLTQKAGYFLGNSWVETGENFPGIPQFPRYISLQEK